MSSSETDSKSGKTIKALPEVNRFPKLFSHGAQRPAPNPGAWLDAMSSFSLRAGMPNFTTGELAMLRQSEDGSLVRELRGTPGFRYLVERQADGANWTPYAVRINPAGAVTFSDESLPNASMLIYGARILELKPRMTPTFRLLPQSPGERLASTPVSSFTVSTQVESYFPVNPRSSASG